MRTCFAKRIVSSIIPVLLYASAGVLHPKRVAAICSKSSSDGQKLMFRVCLATMELRLLSWAPSSLPASGFVRSACAISACDHVSAMCQHVPAVRQCCKREELHLSSADSLGCTHSTGFTQHLCELVAGSIARTFLSSAMTSSQFAWYSA